MQIQSIKKYVDECSNSERAEQITFFNQLRLQYPELAKIAIHPRNEGKRTYAQAAREKREGMTRGAADIIIPGRLSFVCELKTKKGRLSKSQEDYLLAAQAAGAFACVAVGAKAAMHALEKWRADYGIQ